MIKQRSGQLAVFGAIDAGPVLDSAVVALLVDRERVDDHEVVVRGTGPVTHWSAD